MPSYSSEAALVTAAQRLIRARGGVVRKVHQAGYGRVGEPDLDACLQGRSVKLEAKQPGKRPTEAQFRCLREWQGAGALVGWFTSTEDLVEILSHVGEREWVNPQVGAPVVSGGVVGGRLT